MGNDCRELRVCRTNITNSSDSVLQEKLVLSITSLINQKSSIYNLIASAIIFAILSGIVIIFQACLAAGAPWGAASMGGKFPGKYPPKMRVVDVINILLILFVTSIVLSKANMILPQMYSFATIAIWAIVVFSLAATIMNTITPSKIERIWAPVGLIQLITSLIVALQ